MKKKYIPNNSWLTCDKGSIPTQIKVTHDNNSHIYGEKLVSEADMVFGENIQSFGICSITKTPCAYAPIYWDKCNQGVKVNHYKLVFDDANLLCTIGGLIKVDLSIPSIAANISFGGGIGLLREIGIFDGKFSTFAFDLKNNPATALANYTQQGNWGEIRTVQELQKLGYNITSNSHATSVVGAGQGHKGLDVSAYDPKAGIDLLVEAKQSNVTGVDVAPKMNPATPTNPTQMSNQWLTQGQGSGTSRIQNAMNVDDATRVLNNGNVTPLASKVDSQGNIKFYEVDGAGNVGGSVSLPPANVVGNSFMGSTKAANFINSVSNSIQSQKNISAINNAIVKNADEVAKVGKVIGKGTVVIGIAIDTYRLASTAYNDFQDDGKIGRETAEMAGDIAGGIAGGLAGAKLGAAIGAVGGPVGIIVGGVVGGVIGGIVGSGIGRSIVSGIADWF